MKCKRTGRMSNCWRLCFALPSAIKWERQLDLCKDRWRQERSCRGTAADEAVPSWHDALTVQWGRVTYGVPFWASKIWLLAPRKVLSSRLFIINNNNNNFIIIILYYEVAGEIQKTEPWKIKVGGTWWDAAEPSEAWCWAQRTMFLCLGCCRVDSNVLSSAELIAKAFRPSRKNPDSLILVLLLETWRQGSNLELLASTMTFLSLSSRFCSTICQIMQNSNNYAERGVLSICPSA